MKNVLLAGSTGYLGSYILKELLTQNYRVRTVVRNPAKLEKILEGFNGRPEVVEAQVTQPETLTGCCEGMEAVISTVGITRQRDGLTYMDVDYQANLNLLEEALKAGVKKFVYISVFKGESLRHLYGINAKEMFCDRLKSAGIDYTIIRPTGFFSDMADFLHMAQKGRVFLFGEGNNRLNPVHGADLAPVCVNALSLPETEVEAGGPEVFTQNEIAALALKAWGKKGKIVHMPDGLRRFVLWSLKTFTSPKTYGPAEFFLTAMALDFVAPPYGNHKLWDFFREKTKYPDVS